MMVLFFEVCLFKGRCQVFSWQIMLLVVKNSSLVWVLVMNSVVIMLFFLVVMFDRFLLFWCCDWNLVSVVCLIYLFEVMVMIIFLCLIRFLLFMLLVQLMIWVWCGMVNRLWILCSLLVMMFMIWLCEVRMVRNLWMELVSDFSLLVIFCMLSWVRCCRCSFRMVWVCVFDRLQVLLLFIGCSGLLISCRYFMILCVGQWCDIRCLWVLVVLVLLWMVVMILLIFDIVMVRSYSICVCFCVLCSLQVVWWVMIFLWKVRKCVRKLCSVSCLGCLLFSVSMLQLKLVCIEVKWNSWFSIILVVVLCFSFIMILMLLWLDLFCIWVMFLMCFFLVSLVIFLIIVVLLI